jgi:hypothetical protein
MDCALPVKFVSQRITRWEVVGMAGVWFDNLCAGQVLDHAIRHTATEASALRAFGLQQKKTCGHPQPARSDECDQPENAR